MRATWSGTSCSRATTRRCSSTTERALSLERLFQDERCAEALSDESLLAAMVRFEAALAAASAAAGVIPEDAAQAIAAACRVARFDAGRLAAEGRSASTFAIPFVNALTAAVAAGSPQAARYLHLGATSQDVIDTAMALCLRQAAGRLESLALGLGDALAQLARQHADTPTLARTLLQPALPVPFGWKAAMWLAPLARALPHFRAAVRGACVLQFGGAAGTLSAFGGKGSEVAARLARELDLPTAVTWHSARDALARLGSECAILAGLAAKVARDVSLLMQPEIGEAAEPAAAGRGVSSAMPHKRNPAGCLLALEAAQRAPGLAATLLAQLAPEHERGLGHWQSQWLVLRALACGAGSGLAAMTEVCAGLQVDAQAMRANLEASRGLVYSEAVALRLSRRSAERLCEEAVRARKHLREVMRTDAEVAGTLGDDELERLFEPENAFGVAGAMIEQVLGEWSTSRGSAP